MFANRWVGMGCFMVAAILLLLARDPSVLAGPNECPDVVYRLEVCGSAMPSCANLGFVDCSSGRQGVREENRFSANGETTKKDYKKGPTKEMICYKTFPCIWEVLNNKCAKINLGTVYEFTSPGAEAIECTAEEIRERDRRNVIPHER